MSRSLFRHLALLLFFPLICLGADRRAESLTLRSALSRTLQRSPELAAYSFELRAAEARILQAGLRPNPELSLEIENPTGSGSFRDGGQMQNTLSLSQLIELGGKRPARIAEARAGRATVEWDYEVKRVEVLRRTTLAFIDALAAQRRLELAEEICTIYEQGLTITEQRVSVGKVSGVEAIRAKVTVSSSRIDVEQARRDIQIARGTLAAQWGARIADFGAIEGDWSSHKEAPSLSVLRQRVLGNPDLVRWSAEREKRKATLAKEQGLARPDITLMGGPRMEGRAEDASLVVGFSIPLPTSNRNQGNIAEARANLAKLEEEKRAAEARAFAALNEAYQKLTGAAAEIRILEETVIPGAEDAEKQIDEGYAAGRFTQLDVLDARRTLSTSRVQQLRALADYQKALAELDALTAQPAELQRGALASPVRKRNAAPKRK